MLWARVARTKHLEAVGKMLSTRQNFLETCRIRIRSTFGQRFTHRCKPKVNRLLYHVTPFWCAEGTLRNPVQKLLGTVGRTLKVRFSKVQLALLLLTAIITFAQSETPLAKPLLMPPAGVYYHGVYPGGQSGAEDDLTPADVESYEQTVGQRVAWVYFSHNWYNSSTFPVATATWIQERGAVPFIRLMLRSAADNPTPDPRYTLDAILGGGFDAELIAWGQAAKNFRTPLILEWGTEMNGSWFAWNATWNGRAEGAEKFRLAYRHIVETIRAGGASNITWVFHVNDGDDPDESWNALEKYYPGDDVVDWLGVSVYSAQTPQDDYWTNFIEQLDAVMPRLTNLADKPVFVLEFGAAKNNPLGDQAQWADEALTALLSGRWPTIRGFSWWNETWQNDDNPAHDTTMRVQDNEALAEVFRKQLSQDIQGRPRFE